MEWPDQMRKILTVILPLILLMIPLVVFAEEEYDLSELKGHRLIIGTTEAPPFSFRTQDGSWSGISIDLWRKIAEELNLTYEFQERELQSLLGGLSDGSIDVGVAALAITSEREQKIDFTHSFYSTGLAIATSTKPDRDWRAVFRVLFSYELFEAVGLLALLLFAVGMVIWLFERKGNRKDFGGSISRGLWSGFWWSAVTMTTVGYGDKTPKTVGGRVVGLIWMFTAVITISSFTAGITSVITLTQLEPVVTGVDDLPDMKVGSIFGSVAADYLHDNRILYKSYDDPLEGLREVDLGRIDAMVYDAPILQYLSKTRLGGRVKVLSTTFERQEYGIGLKEGSPLLEPINHVLLRKIHQPEWNDVLYMYLGQN